MELISSEELEDVEIERVDFPGDVVPDLYEISKQLIEEVNKHNALGIAAPQVGIPKKLAIVRFKGEEGKKDTLLPVINPLYFPKGSRAQFIEGCLSYEDEEFTIKRYKSIKARFFAFDPEGKVIRPVEMILSGRDALVFQHEADHCNGVTCATKGKRRKTLEKQ